MIRYGSVVAIIQTTIDENYRRVLIVFSPGSHWLWDMIQEYWILLSHPMMRRMYDITWHRGHIEIDRSSGRVRAYPLYDILYDELSSDDNLRSLTYEDDYYVNVPRLPSEPGPGRSSAYAYLALPVSTAASRHEDFLFAERSGNRVYLRADIAPFADYYDEAYDDLNNQLSNTVVLFDQGEYGFDISQRSFDAADPSTYKLDAEQTHCLNRICYGLTRYFSCRTRPPRGMAQYLAYIEGWASPESFDRHGHHYQSYRLASPRGPSSNQELSMARAAFVASYIDHWMRASGAFEHFNTERLERVRDRRPRSDPARRVILCRRAHVSPDRPTLTEDYMFAESRRQRYRRPRLRYMRNSFGISDYNAMFGGWADRFVVMGRGETRAFREENTWSRDANRRVVVNVGYAAAPGYRAARLQQTHLLCPALDSTPLLWNYRITEVTRTSVISETVERLQDSLLVVRTRGRNAPQTIAHLRTISYCFFLLWLLEENRFVRYPLYQADIARQRGSEIRGANIVLAVCRYDTLIRSYAARRVFLVRPVRNDSEQCEDSDDIHRFFSVSDEWYEHYVSYWRDVQLYFTSSGNEPLDNRLNAIGMHRAAAQTNVYKLSNLYELWDDLNQSNRYRGLASTPGGSGPNRQYEYLWPSNYSGRTLDGSCSRIAGLPIAYPYYIHARRIQTRIRQLINARRIAYPMLNGAVPSYGSVSARQPIPISPGTLGWSHPYAEIVGSSHADRYEMYTDLYRSNI